MSDLWEDASRSYVPLNERDCVGLSVNKTPERPFITLMHCPLSEQHNEALERNAIRNLSHIPAVG